MNWRSGKITELATEQQKIKRTNNRRKLWEIDKAENPEGKQVVTRVLRCAVREKSTSGQCYLGKRRNRWLRVLIPGRRCWRPGTNAVWRLLFRQQRARKRHFTSERTNIRCLRGASEQAKRKGSPTKRARERASFNPQAWLPKRAKTFRPTSAHASNSSAKAIE